MAITKEQVIDILEKFDFFQGQRAGRELWNSKPKEVQDEDTFNFSKDVALLKEYIADVVPRSEYEKMKEKADRFHDNLKAVLDERAEENHEVERLTIALKTHKIRDEHTQALLYDIDKKISEGYELSAAKACAEAEMWRMIALREKQREDEICRLHATCTELTQKVQDVAREIFEEFRNAMRSEIAKNEELFKEDEDDFYDGRNDAFRTAINFLAELTKKYIGD